MDVQTIDEFHRLISKRLFSKKCKTSSPSEKKILFLGNQTTKLMESVVSGILCSLDCCVSISHGPYDDSLSSLPNEETDLCILVYDVQRSKLKGQAFVDWFDSALQKISIQYNCHVIGAPLGGDIWLDPTKFQSLSQLEHGIHIFVPDGCNSNWSYETLLHESLNIPRERVFSYAIEMTNSYISSALGIDIRLILCDLDNTLYEGVLGEDGIEELSLSHANYQLQEDLVEQIQKGIPVYFITKNDPQDVVLLFRDRVDFPLHKLKDLLMVRASWNEKSNVIDELIIQANLDPANCLFIDDNFYELNKVQNVLQKIRVWHFFGQYKEILRLKNFPGVNKLRTDNEATIRIQDIEARKKRSLNQIESTPIKTLAKLNTKIDLEVDVRGKIPRIVELLHKTNQFNCRLKRSTLSEIESGLTNQSLHLVSATVSDDLSESGTIFAMVVNDEEIIELVISCRALGRGLEDILVCSAIAALNSRYPKDEYRLNFVKGPRNEPAENWWNSFGGREFEVLNRNFAEVVFHEASESLSISIVYGGGESGQFD